MGTPRTGNISEPRVAAVVVTHDRLSDLKSCVNAVRSQTYPVAGTAIVDNASTDGTREWLAAQDDIHAIYQGDVGAAGGIYTGIEYAYQQGFDAIWVLDDDALPAETALERLIKAKANDGTNVVGSFIVSRDDPEVLSFAVPKISSYNALLDHYRQRTDRVADLRAESEERGYPWSMFMNSVLLPRHVVADVGLPMREFYMGGEETEYHYRVRSHGYGTYLIPDSICRHPKRSSREIPRWRERSLVRNTVYIHRQYRRWFLLRTVRRLVLYAAAGRRDLVGALWDGVRGDFSQRYGDAEISKTS